MLFQIGPRPHADGAVGVEAVLESLDPDIAEDASREGEVCSCSIWSFKKDGAVCDLVDSCRAPRPIPNLHNVSEAKFFDGCRCRCLFFHMFLMVRVYVYG